MYGGWSIFQVPLTFRSENASSISYSDGPNGPPWDCWTIETRTVAESVRSDVETRTTRAGRGSPGVAAPASAPGGVGEVGIRGAVVAVDHGLAVPLHHSAGAGLIQ